MVAGRDAVAVATRHDPEARRGPFALQLTLSGLHHSGDRRLRREYPREESARVGEGERAPRVFRLYLAESTFQGEIFATLPEVAKPVAVTTVDGFFEGPAPSRSGGDVA